VSVAEEKKLSSEDQRRNSCLHNMHPPYRMGAEKQKYITKVCCTPGDLPFTLS